MLFQCVIKKKKTKYKLGKKVKSEISRGITKLLNQGILIFNARLKWITAPHIFRKIYTIWEKSDLFFKEFAFNLIKNAFKMARKSLKFKC